MNKAIIIPTHHSNQQWLLNCLEKLRGCKYPVIILHNGDVSEYEMKAIKYGMNYTDEFIVLQDTIEVKNLEVFDLFFSFEGVVFGNPHGQMFFNKYVSSDLKSVSLPVVNDKASAVSAETQLHNKLIPSKILFPELVDNPSREEKFGRNNMVLENSYIKKFKSVWCKEMIK